MLNVCDICDISSEAGVIASAILNPEFVFYSEQLTPHHFTNEQNGYLYFAICELARKNITQIDAYNITNILNSHSATKVKADEILNITTINEFIECAPNIARSSIEEYKMLADNVLSAAFRRNTFNKLTECQRYCFNDNDRNFEQKIYQTLDDVMMEFSTTKEIPEYKDVVDVLWNEIESRQDGGVAGIPFKFPTLNNYATIERGELFVFAADAKQGKSMMLLNCAVDLMKRDVAVLYLDSELNSRMFTCRLISHLSGIEFSRVKAGQYTLEEGEKIKRVIAWLKTRKFVHLYIPTFDSQSIYTAVKKIKHTMGLDVLIVDYFKSGGNGDAFDTYQELGRFVDTVKNKICGELNIAGLGAAQATSSGKVADSAKIARNASTIALLQDKTQEEIEIDGIECGNKKLRICFNRNGAQMFPDEYIDLKFQGNLIKYEEARQHTPHVPY